MSTPSVVKMHNQSYTLTIPSGVTGDWDATVAFTGCMSCMNHNPTLATSTTLHGVTYDSTDLSSGTAFGSLIVKAGAAGEALRLQKVDNQTHTALAACDPGSSLDRCRLIAVAYEVTNTTADMYRQGSVTTAALHIGPGDFKIATYKDSNETPIADSFKQVWFGPTFAATRSSLISVPGSSTWAARDGVYAIPRLTTGTIGAEVPHNSDRAVLAKDTSSSVHWRYSKPSALVDLEGSIPYVEGVSASGFLPIQSFFTGLSEQTALTVTFRTIVEYFPEFTSPLLPLASPSTPYNPAALEYYSEIARIAPYAVPVSENEAGDYFRRIAKIASTILKATAPMMGGWAGPADFVARGLDSVIEYTRRKPAQKKKKPQVRIPNRRTVPVARRAAGAGAMPTRRR